MTGRHLAFFALVTVALIGAAVVVLQMLPRPLEANESVARIPFVDGVGPGTAVLHGGFPIGHVADTFFIDRGMDRPADVQALLGGLYRHGKAPGLESSSRR